MQRKAINKCDKQF